MENYQENSKRTKRVQDASTVIGFLASQTPTEPVLERTDLAQQQFIHVTDKAHGWDSEGRYW